MIKCFINGIGYELIKPFTIAEKLGNKISSKIKIKVDDQRIPKAGDLIELVEDGNTLFIGTCGIPKSPKFKNVNTLKIYNIVCGNGNSILARRNVNYATQNKTITEIVEYFYDNIIFYENIAKGEISDIPVTLDAYTAPDMNLQDVLNELAKYVSGAWQVTNDRVFNFIAKDDFEAFPEIINADNFIGATIQTQTKDQDMRTSQIVTGLEDRTDTQAETFVYDGQNQSFSTIFAVAEEPSKIMRDDGVTIYADKIGVRGLDDNNHNVIFLFSNKSREIQYKDNTNWLSANQSFTIYYVGIYTLRVRSFNFDKIGEIAAKTGTSGLIEHVHQDKTLTTLEDAEKLANSLISNYGKELTEVKFELTGRRIKASGYTLSDFSLGKKITLDLSEIGLNGDFVITERLLESTSAAGKFEDNVKAKLKLLDRSYIKSYGETLNRLIKEKNFSIRDNIVIISQEQIEENHNFTEQVIVGYGAVAYWPTSDISTENDPLTGLNIYPC